MKFPFVGAYKLDLSRLLFTRKSKATVFLRIRSSLTLKIKILKLVRFFSRGLSHFVPAFVATRSFTAGVTAGVLGAIFSSLFEDVHEPDEKTAEALNNPLIVQKLIELLNVELTDFDLKIEFQEFKLSQITNDSDLYALEMETLFKLKSQKSDILKKIKELEIHKACLESV